MITVAALCGVAGLVLGLSSNVRMFVLIVLMIAFAAFLAGMSNDGSLLLGLGWALTALVTTQVAYVLMVFLRAGWIAAQAKSRQPVPY
jgi:4-amino-4-deoxy-L-arabinose transferase-like glycosyltransferase